MSYPGLPHHPGHAVLRRLLNRGYGYGGLIGVDMGTAAKAEAVSVMWTGTVVVGNGGVCGAS